MQVLKFGGTSVASAEMMQKVVDIATDALARDRTILVASAISKCTDTLIDIGRQAAERDSAYLDKVENLYDRHLTLIGELLPDGYRKQAEDLADRLFDSLRGIVQGVYLLGELSATSLSAIESYGELLSTRILAIKFASLGVACEWIDSREIIKTVHGAVDTGATYRNIRKAVESHPHTPLFIAPGFIASDEKGRTCTLGRGGSDYTASLYAVGVKARLVEIWTDVTGIMTANPKVVPAARTIGHISYRAAQELSHFGAKVIYPPTIQPVVEEGIPIYVKNTFAPSEAGTLVERNPPRVQGTLIGISNSDNIALISLEGSGMVGVPGFSARLFDTLYRSGINIILITQASSVHTMCIAIAEEDAARAKAAADECFAYEISLGELNPLKIETGFSIVCLIGDDILGHSGATGRMLAALGAHGIPVRATAQGSSERNISVIVPSENVNASIRAIHSAFFDTAARRTVNLFMAGYGTVGKALAEILAAHADEIAARTGKELRLCGIANSRHYAIDREGLDWAALPQLLQRESGTKSYFEALADLSMDHSVFLDCTASQDIGLQYPELFKAGYSVVSCNKIPFSGPFHQYAALKRSAIEAGVSLRHATTAGAALPILASIRSIIQSGDRIRRIEAVLSGTLNYLFSRYEGHDFAALIEEARQKGYTEPDPQTDLSGRDVLRKVLILAREMGFPLEERDVELTPIPEEAEIGRRYQAALQAGRRLRHVAVIDAEGHASISVQAVGADSPLYALTGTDNIAVITSGLYPSPLVIRGAGAGAFQTASGLLNDILT